MCMILLSDIYQNQVFDKVELIDKLIKENTK